jgi:hypothetical protein
MLGSLISQKGQLLKQLTQSWLSSKIYPVSQLPGSHLPRSAISHFKHLSGQLVQNPGEVFSVNPGLQLVEKLLLVAEHAKAFVSLQITQACPFSKAKPGKQLLQTAGLLFEQDLQEESHLIGTPLTKAYPSSAYEQIVLLVVRLLLFATFR